MSSDGHEHSSDDHAHELTGDDTLSAAATYEHARTGGVCVWWQLTTFIDVSGPEAAAFLDAVTTQHVERIGPGSARHTLFLTQKARIIAPALAYRPSDDRVLLEVEPALADELIAHLRRYRLRAKCAIEPADLAAVSIVGPASQELLRGDDAGWHGSPAWGVPAATFIGDRDAAAQLTVDLPRQGFGLAAPEALDALRIEHGVPMLNDMAPGHMPAEVGGMGLAVALDKGCYLGQEPVARLHYRGHANRTLRQVRLAAAVPADYGMADDIADDDYLALERPPQADGGAARRVGMLTSWATAPGGSIVGLGIIRREVVDGEELRLVGTDVAVTPCELHPATSAS